MLKFGTIKSYDPAKGLVSVVFEADNLVIEDMPILFKKTLTDREFAPLDNNEHVACLMDENCEHGVCLGAIYSTNETPPSGISKDQFGFKFANGDYWRYDRQSKNFKWKMGNDVLFLGSDSFVYSNGTTEFSVNPTTGKFTLKNAGEDLKTLLGDLISAIEGITVTYINAGGTPTPTTVPNNNAAFAAIAARVTNFLD